MNDKHPEVVTVELGGKPRRLKLGPAALRLAEMRGAPVTNEEMQSPTFTVLARLLWVALLPDNRELEEADVLEWLTQSEDEMVPITQVAKLLGKMSRDFVSAFGESEDEAKK